MPKMEAVVTSVQFTQSSSILCNPVDCNMPGFLVHHQLPELAQAHVHWDSYAIQHLILCRPLLLLPPILPIIRVFSSESVFPIRRPKYWRFSISPFNEYLDWFPLGWTSWISLLSKGLSSVFSNITAQSISSLALSFLYNPTLTSIDEYWKNHSFD